MQTDVINAVRRDELNAIFSVAEIDTIAEYAANIVECFHRANADTIDSGAAWYGEARAFAARLAHDYGISLEAACAVLAVTSPSIHWSSQLRYTGALIAACRRNDKDLPGPFYVANKEKARRIVNGEPPLSVVSGNKVLAFFWNIYDDASDCVTVDRHAIRIATGVDYSPEECKRIARPTSRQRLMIVTAYHLAARRLQLRTAVVQAITWVVYRGAA